MWSQNEINIAISLLKIGKTYFEIGIELNKTPGSIRSKLFKLGYNFNNEQNFYITRKCLSCDNEFEVLRSEKKKFCSHSCSATYNNKLRFKLDLLTNNEKKCCLNCNIELKRRNKNYCCNSCQGEHVRKLIYEKIKNGDVSFSEKTYKEYLISLNGNKCMECGWDKINPKTGKIPIQLEHVDGNSENNELKNLKLLCPNCHSLTPTFGALNKGYGRKKRYKK